MLPIWNKRLFSVFLCEEHYQSPRCHITHFFTVPQVFNWSFGEETMGICSCCSSSHKPGEAWFYMSSYKLFDRLRNVTTKVTVSTKFCWYKIKLNSNTVMYFKGRHVRTGIGGIERKLQEKSKQVDKNISVAFEDLGKLMEKVLITFLFILSLNCKTLQYAGYQFT